jgi:hypothetical protein
LYDYDYANGNSTTSHFTTQIVGPTNEEGYTDYVETLDNATFQLGVKELGLYVDGDKEDESSYAIPTQYTTPTEDTVITVEKNSETATAEVHNECLGYIAIIKMENGTNKFLPNAKYGIFKEKIYSDSSDDVDMEDNDDVEETEDIQENTDDLDYDDGIAPDDGEDEDIEDTSTEDIDDSSDLIEDNSDDEDGEVVEATEDDIQESEDITEDEDLSTEGGVESENEGTWLMQEQQMNVVML